MPPYPAGDSCVAFLVRHGATENNLADPPLLQGRRVDPGLSEEGRRQAARTGNMLARQPLAGVYSSPLLRAMETARLIADPLGLAVEQVAALHEVDVGSWEGRSWVEIAETEPEAHQRFLEDAATFGYPCGENMREVLDRVLPVMEHLLQSHVGQQIAVVGHNVVNRVFLAHLLGVPLSQARRVSHDNCGVSVVCYRDGHIKLVTLNSVFHLDVESKPNRLR